MVLQGAEPHRLTHSPTALDHCHVGVEGKSMGVRYEKRALIQRQAVRIDHRRQGDFEQFSILRRRKVHGSPRTNSAAPRTNRSYAAFTSVDEYQLGLRTWSSPTSSPV